VRCRRHLPHSSSTTAGARLLHVMRASESCTTFLLLLAPLCTKWHLILRACIKWQVRTNSFLFIHVVNWDKRQCTSVLLLLTQKVDQKRMSLAVAAWSCHFEEKCF
jgi:hypothetical protein